MEIQALPIRSTARLIAEPKCSKEPALGHGPHVILMQIVAPVALFAQSAQPMLADCPFQAVAVVRG